MRRSKRLLGATLAIIFSGLAQTVGPIRLNVSQRPHKHPEVAVESSDPPHGVRPVVVE